MQFFQGPAGNKVLVLLVLVLVVSNVVFIVSMRSPAQGTTVACPEGTGTPSTTTVICPSCGGGISREPATPYVPRPVVKRAEEALIDKLRKHQLNLMNVHPWYLFESTYECTMGEDRIGYIGEGGKWLCGLYNLLQVPNCIIYSMGSNGQHDFEDDIMANTECELHVFDMDDFTHSFVNTRAKFHKAKIGDGTDGSVTIDALMKQLGHDHIDLLKIDIEMGEYAAFEHLANQVNPQPWIGQVLVEFHLIGANYQSLTRERKYEYIDKIIRLVDNLHNLGLVQYHREDNPISVLGSEYAYGNLRPRPTFN